MKKDLLLKAAVPALINALKNDNVDVEVKKMAAEALGKIGDETEDVTSALQASKSNDEVKDSAIMALKLLKVSSKPRNKASVPIFIDALKDEDTRRYAMEVLGDIGADAEAAVPALIELLKDKNYWNRCVVVSTLEKIVPGFDKNHGK